MSVVISRTTSRAHTLSPAPPRRWVTLSAMSKTVLFRVGVAGCATALVAGCGASSPHSTPAVSGMSGSPSHSSTPSPATVAPASIATLKTIVLQPSDLPAGWKGAAYKPDPHSAATDAAMSTCLGVHNTSKDKVAEAHSQDYSLGNATVSSSATSYKSQGDLNTDIAALHSSKMSTCFDQLVRTQLASSLPAGAAIVSESFKVTPGSDGGPSNVIATGQGTIKVSASGQQFAVYLSVAFITGPLIEAETDTENLGAPVPSSIVKSLVAAVATRAAKG